MENIFVILICITANILMMVLFVYIKSSEKRTLLEFYAEQSMTVDRLSFYGRKTKGLGISKVLCGCLLAGIIFSSSGIVLLRAGAFPQLQRLLVTSSMTTLSHKYIAYIAAEPDTVENIMEANRVEEVVEVSNTDLIDPYYDEVRKMRKQVIVEDIPPLIKVDEISGEGYKGYMMFISDPSRVCLAVPSSLGSHGKKITQLVNESNALAGINAGGFTDPEGKGNGGVPTGLIIKDGKMVYCQKGMSKYNLIGFNKDNVLVLGGYTLDEIKQLNIRDGVAFKPFLVINGNPTKIYGDGGWGIAPRTAIGQKKDGTVLFLVIDGRQPIYSIGASIKELQNIMVQYGAVNAANLDGGSSAVMHYEGRIINKPCSKAGDRYLPSAFIVK